MAIKCPVKNCDKKFVDTAFAEKHADEMHKDWRIPKSKGWVTPDGFVDFTEPVTYQYACDFAKQLGGELKEKFNIN